MKMSGPGSSHSSGEDDFEPFGAVAGPSQPPESLKTIVPPLSCTFCQERKVKCSGTFPCTYCVHLKRDTLCVGAQLAPFGKKRGPNIVACFRCQQRKIKCSKTFPCTYCIKQGYALNCIKSSQTPVRKRPAKEVQDEQDAKMKRYEALLIEMGVDLDAGVLESEDGEQGGDRKGKRKEGDMEDDNDQEPADNYSTRKEMKGLLIEDSRGEKRYLETAASHLITDLDEEFQEIGVYDTTSAEKDHEYPDIGNLMIDAFPSDMDLSHIHPQPDKIARLWQAFVDNVNPLVKILHTPSTQLAVFDASNKIKSIPKEMEALMFGIYSAGVNGLPESECEIYLGEKKMPMMVRYHSALLRALQRADFLKSTDIRVIQAFVLFLISARSHYDSRSLWAISGVLVRIAQGMGLHRDAAALGLSPFDVEIRRRLWWQIVIVDSRLSQLAGSGNSILSLDFDTQVPSNVNDNELSPSMQEMVQSDNADTEMIFCLVRYEIGEFLRTSGSTKTLSCSWQKLASPSIPLIAKDTAINELENQLHTKFLSRSDSSIPLHFMAMAVCRSAVAKMRLIAHHPRHYPGGFAAMPQAERDVLFNASVTVSELDSTCNTMEGLRRFQWHIKANFQIDAFIYMISELRYRTEGEIVERAWVLVEAVYNHHPELLSKGDPIYIAIGNLTFKAFEAREKARGIKHDSANTSFPKYIYRLFCQRKPANVPDPFAKIFPQPTNSQDYGHQAHIAGPVGYSFCGNEGQTQMEHFGRLDQADGAGQNHVTVLADSSRMSVQASTNMASTGQNANESGAFFYDQFDNNTIGLDFQQGDLFEPLLLDGTMEFDWDYLLAMGNNPVEEQDQLMPGFDLDGANGDFASGI